MDRTLLEAKIVIATKNQGKASELALMLQDLPFEFLTSKEIDFPEVIEDGLTFEENAGKKALETARATGLYAIADDSGLEVEALGNAPGVYSARYAGIGAKDQDSRAKLLRELSGIKNRKARFRCTLAFASPEKVLFIVSGSIAGIILEKECGTNGFGYDPLFFVEEEGKSFAEMSKERKNQISHRAKALKELKFKFSAF